MSENIERLQRKQGEWATETDSKSTTEALNARVARLKTVSDERDEMHIKLEPYKEDLYRLFHKRIVDFKM